jgi:hypothetical protein
MSDSNAPMPMSIWDIFPFSGIIPHEKCAFSLQTRLIIRLLSSLTSKSAVCGCGVYYPLDLTKEFTLQVFGRDNIFKQGENTMTIKKQV